MGGQELQTAFSILIPELQIQVENYYALKSEGVEFVTEEIENLRMAYSALQVILCRLGDHMTGFALAECNLRCNDLISRNIQPHFPRINFKGFQFNDDCGSLNYLSVNKILSAARDTSVILYTVCDTGFLCYLFNSDTKEAKCYLLSDNVANPQKTMDRLNCLIGSIQTRDKQCSSANNIYRTENRSLPDLTKHSSLTESNIKLDKLEINESDIEISYDDAMTEIYLILIQPFQSELNTLKRHSKLCIIPSSYLYKVPFDQLISPANGKALADRFNISVSPCILVLDNGPKTFGQHSSIRRIEKEPNRHMELQKSYENQKDLATLEFLGLDKKILGIVSSTSTGTNIITSPRYITAYRQIDSTMSAYVIGNPYLPQTLNLKGNVWEVGRKTLAVAQKECLKIAEYLDVIPIYGKEASKSKFLSCLSNTSLLHICTYACMKNGLLLFSPDDFASKKPPFHMKSCVVSLSDLLDIKINVKLVVLSCGHGWANENLLFTLPRIFLTAGVESVVFSLWPVPDYVSSTFYFHFYLKLQTSCSVARALYEAKVATKEKYSDPQMWNSFVLLGRDNTINISEIKNSQTHGYLSKTEEGILQPTPLVQIEKSPEEIFHKLQQCVASLNSNLDTGSSGDVVSFIIGLLEEATNRLTSDENSELPVVILPKSLQQNNGVIDLLELLGFDFQKVDLRTLPSTVSNTFQDDVSGERRQNNSALMVIFPHWNQENLLLPTHQLMDGLHEFCPNESCLQCIANMLPLSQHDICHLIDLLCVTYHKPDWQLRKDDSTTNKIWGCRNMRKFLKSIGFIAVRNYLLFRRTLKNRSLLVGSLQFFVAISLYREHSIMEHLNVDIIGQLPVNQPQGGVIESLNPVIMPRNEIHISSTWMQDGIYKNDSSKRKNLAEEISEKTDKYSRILEHARWWHKNIRIPQTAHSVTSELGSGDANFSPRKVKVQPGATPSCVREPVESDPDGPRNLFETLRLREGTRVVLNRRCCDVDQRHASAVRQSYVPYCVKFD